MKNIPPTNGEKQVILYKAKDGSAQVDVRLQDETIWLNLNQIAQLFGRDKSAISRHIRNIFATGELGISTVAKFATVQKEGAKAVKRDIEYYNLDMIISVGYRVNSKRGTQFRIWATDVLRRHLVEGFTLHRHRLQERGVRELHDAIALIERTGKQAELSTDEAKGLLGIVTEYTQTWLLLRKYDDGQLEAPKRMRTPRYRLTSDAARTSIEALRANLLERKEASNLFGIERSHMLESIIGNLYQTFDRKELYRTVEEKAAHLLYFVIKDHPFTDGNKRIGALLFLTFLDANGILGTKGGSTRMHDATLVALALLIAESKPQEKETMLRLILHFLSPQEA